MPHKPKLNRLIQLLEEGKPAFGTHVSNGNLDEISHAATAGYDFVFIENEHVGMDFSQLRVSLQFFLNRRSILEQGSLQANPTPLVRVAPNTEEMNQWVLKQTLDHGVYGALLPKVESVEAARAAVLACRYPQKRGAEHSLGRAGLESRHGVPLLGPYRTGILRSRRPMAPGSRRRDLPHGHLRISQRRSEPARHSSRSAGNRWRSGGPGRPVRDHGRRRKSPRPRGSASPFIHPQHLQAIRRSLRRRVLNPRRT